MVNGHIADVYKRQLQVGDTVDINISSEDTRWNNVQHAVGAMYWILKDGKVDTSICLLYTSRCV